jgi:tetratricopeptide (TPR) repeat protein
MQGAIDEAIREGAWGPGLVGRERELDELDAALEQAADGRGALFMVGGDPGVGKTTLLEAACDRARGGGATVTWGRCWEAGGAPAYWPWVQAIRSLTRGCSADVLAARLGAGAPHVVKLVPGLADQLPAVGDPPDLDPDRARFALFDAVAGFLQATSDERPLVVALDDMHAADRPSLLLLQFVAHELRDSRMLVLAAYREVEARLAPPRAKLISHLSKDARRVSLSGLDAESLERLIAQTAGTTPSKSLVRAVHDATEGNPFFVDEVVRRLAAEGRLDNGHDRAQVEIPHEVRDAVRHRLTPLPEAAREILSLASVFGREFSLAAVRQVSGRPGEELIDVLEDALARGIVDQVPGGLGRYTFDHALIRETLYGDLSPGRRTRLHRAAGEALESLYEGDVEPHLAELAYHFFEAASAGEPSKAIDYSVAAAERAMSMLAYEEAAAHYERALQAYGLEEGADPVRRCDLLLALGEAQGRAGDVAHARETLQHAITLARRLGDAERLARAALAHGAGLGGFAFGRADAALIGFLREAREALGPEDGPLLARVTGRLAVELYFRGLPAERDELSAEAVEIAQRLDDPVALASALSARHLALWGPENLDERMETASELVRLGNDTGDRDLSLRGSLWRFADLMEACDVIGADRDLERLMAHADELRDPLYVWHVPVFRAMRAILEGDFSEGERLAEQAYAVGRQAGAHTADWLFAIQVLALRREQGRLDEIEPYLAAFSERFPDTPHWRTGVVYVTAELGRHAEAAAGLRPLAANDFAVIPRDGEWLPAMGMLAEAAALTGDTEIAERLYELMTPYADRNVVAGRGAASFGPAARYCGVLAAALGRYDEADAHFDAAEEMSRRTWALPALARTRCDRAAALVGRGDRAAAEPLLGAALELSVELGMGAVERRARELGGAEPAAAPAAPAPTGERRRGVLRREGEFWTVSFGETTFRLKDSKGLQHVARLVAHPGVEVHAIELVTGDAGPAAAGAAAQAREAGLEAQQGGDDAGPALDATAKEDYRRRLEELREEAEEAESFNDPERAARAREEMDFIARELSSAVGLGGRDRRASSTAERARVNATRNIRSALGRVAANDEDLGRHMERTIRTGTFCVYEPDPSEPVDWEVDAGGS